MTLGHQVQDDPSWFGGDGATHIVEECSLARSLAADDQPRMPAFRLARLTRRDEIVLKPRYLVFGGNISQVHLLQEIGWNRTHSCTGLVLHRFDNCTNWLFQPVLNLTWFTVLDEDIPIVHRAQ